MHHLFAAISVIGLVIAVVAFTQNRAGRAEINSTLSSASPALEAPERLFWRPYNEDYLKDVGNALGRAMLDRYRRPVLLWNDVIFAVALAIFSASLWMWILFQFELSGIFRHMVIVSAASALLYGVFDTAEDITLERLLKNPESISKSEAWAACLLTRIKIITNGASITGGLVFLTLSSLSGDSKSTAAIKLHRPVL
jgi:hypothetical protein